MMAVIEDDLAYIAETSGQQVDGQLRRVDSPGGWRLGGVPPIVNVPVTAPGLGYPISPITGDT